MWKSSKMDTLRAFVTNSLLLKVEDTESHICTHTAPTGIRYPYKLEQRKGWYFLILFYVVKRISEAVFQKTYGPLSNCDFAIFT